jgi:hypothetical protein
MINYRVNESCIELFSFCLNFLLTESIFVVSTMQFFVFKLLHVQHILLFQAHGYTNSLFPFLLNAIWKMANRLRGTRSPTVTDRNPDSWLPAFASRIYADFIPNQYHVPEGRGSTKFGWLADAFTMDEFEVA